MTHIRFVESIKKLGLKVYQRHMIYQTNFEIKDKDDILVAMAVKDKPNTYRTCRGFKWLRSDTMDSLINVLRTYGSTKIDERGCI